MLTMADLGSFKPLRPVLEVELGGGGKGGGGGRLLSGFWESVGRDSSDFVALDLVTRFVLALVVSWGQLPRSDRCDKQCEDLACQDSDYIRYLHESRVSQVLKVLSKTMLLLPSHPVSNNT